MKTYLTNPNLPTSIWQTLHHIDNLLGQSLPWSKRLEAINSILITELEFDAIWLLTINPLPVRACGSMATPLVIAPQAQVHIVDTAPPVANGRPPADSLLGQVLQTQEPQFIDPQQSSLSQTDSDLGDVLFGTFEAIPSAIVPLMADNNSIGALVVGNYAVKDLATTEDLRNILLYLGNYVGANLQNAYLVERSQRHTNVLETVNLIAQTITSSLDIDEVIQRTMAGINALLEVEAGSLLLLDEENEELYFKMTLRGENKELTSHRLKLDEGIAGWVVSNNRPTISNHSQHDKRFSAKIDNAIGFDTKMVLCVPLIVQGKPIGALEVLNKQTGYFDADDQELLASLAASLTIALNNAFLYEATQQRAKQTEIINQIVATVNTGQGLLELGKLIFEQLSRLITFDHISLSLLDDSRQNIQQWILTEHGALEYSKSLIPLANSALAHLFQSNQAQVYDHISTTPSAPDDQILHEDGIKSKMALPLITKSRPFGSLNLGRQLAQAYGVKDLHLLEELMPQLAVAIEKSRLIDAMNRHNQELRRLNHFNEMLVSTTDIGLIVDTTLSMMPRLLPGEVQAVMIAGEQGAYLGVAVPFDFSQTEKTVRDIQETFQELNDGDASMELIYHKNLAGHLPVTPDWEPVTVLHLPLLTRLGTVGLIYIASGVHETLSDEVWRTFSLIASQISAAVENARLFRQVEHERARLAAILSNSTNAILVVNRDGRIVLDNPAAWEVMGVEESQRDKRLSECTNNTRLIQLFEESMHGEQSNGEIPLSDGRTFFANLSPVALSDIDVIGSVATMQDVSRFKELNQLKTDFVNSVSHDLRSPLSGILIAAHLLPQIGEISATQAELLQTIESRVGTMSRLIDDLLDVSKIEAGIEMEMEPYALSQIIEEVTTSLIPLAQDKSIDLTYCLPEQSPTIQTNPTRLRQVVHNLVANAIKYTPNDGKVTVTLTNHEEEARIQVADTGLGIPTADQPHIFEKFYRVRGDHVADIKGTGLGLAITKGIVEKHHGRIWLESIFGEGSTFTVALPTYQTDQ